MLRFSPRFLSAQNKCRCSLHLKISHKSMVLSRQAFSNAALSFRRWSHVAYRGVSLRNSAILVLLLYKCTNFEKRTRIKTIYCKHKKAHRSRSVHKSTSTSYSSVNSFMASAESFPLSLTLQKLSRIIRKQLLYKACYRPVDFLKRWLVNVYSNTEFVICVFQFFFSVNESAKAA